MDIIIGIGGTGAKVVEAVLNLAAMGIGPNTLKVGFVDQDASNGNLNRAITVFENYRDARRFWRDGAPHQIDGTADCQLLKTNVQPIHGNDGRWIPEIAAGATLSRIFGDMGSDKFLFDALFESGDDEEFEEQDLDLARGYRARPNIGAAAMTLRSLDENDAFWTAITAAIQDANAGDVRIMLAGSIFGGTGAAGFPTIARLITNRLQRAGITKRVKIGGILMQPYFWFPDPGNGDEPNVARAHEQKMQAKGALEHYARLLGPHGEDLFDHLYLVGWNRPFRIDRHNSGLGAQRNPALFPEFLAATAAMRFFATQWDADAPATQEILESARAEDHLFEWPEIPPIWDQPDSKQALHQQIGQFLRFATAFKFWKPQISDDRQRSALDGQKWYKGQGLSDVDWVNNSPAAALNQLERVIDNVLAWGACIDAYARRDANHRFNLWHIGVPLLDAPVDFDTPNEDPEIATEISGADYNTLFSLIVHKYVEGDGPMPNTIDLSDSLTDFTVEGNHQGMGRFVSALYNFSGIRPVVVAD